MGGDWERRRDPAMSRTARGHQRKDRKRWCRGKPGVEHEGAYGRLRNQWSYDQPCGWVVWSRDNWPWPAWRNGACCSYWRCCEQEYCAVCGKIVRNSLGDDCTTRWVTPGKISRVW